MTNTEFAKLAWAQTWQLTLLIVVIAVVSSPLAKRRPHLAHVLWLVVLAKCLTPPLVASSGSVFSWLQPARTIVSGDQVKSSDVIPTSDAETSQLPEIDAARQAGSATIAEVFRTSRNSVLNGDVVQVKATVPAANVRSHELIDTLILWTAWLWLGGSIALMSTALLRWGACLRQIRSATAFSRPDLVKMVADLSRRLHVTQRVRLIVTASRIGPAVIGIFRPTILLPMAVVGGKSARELEAILAHELIHVRRGDLWIGLVQVIAQAIWWFHPLVWLANRWATRSAEACCDEEVVAELGCDPGSYAESLLEILELKRRLITVPVFPGMRPVDVTRERLERIMQFGQGCRPGTPWWCWVVLVLTAAATLPGAALVVSADEAKEEAKPQATDAPEVSQAETARDQGARAEVPTKAKEPRYLPLSRMRGETAFPIGRFFVRIIPVVRKEATEDPSAKAEGVPSPDLKSTVRIIVRPADAETEREQTMSISAERIQSGMNSSVQPTNSPIEFELDGSVEWLVGDARGTARRGRLTINRGRDSDDPFRVWITTELTGDVRWKSDHLDATCERLRMTLGQRGDEKPPKIGLHTLRLDENVQLKSDDIVATANGIGLCYFRLPENRELPEGFVTGYPQNLLFDGRVSLTLSSPNANRQTISADWIHYEGNGNRWPTGIISSKNMNRRETTMEGRGVNSGAGVVGEVLIAETVTNAKESTGRLMFGIGAGFFPNAAKVKPIESDSVGVEAVKTELSTVTYAVADLIVPYSKFNGVVSPTEDAKAEKVPQSGNENETIGYKVHQPPSGDGFRTRDTSKANSGPLIQLIQATIAPESWDAAGGPGSIREFTTTLSLVVRNTQQVHDKIAELMRQLRQLQSQQATVDVEIFHHAAVAATSSLEEIVPTETAKRGADLTKEQLRAFREHIKADGQKWSTEDVKLALHNGQGAELILRCLYRPDTERPPLMQLNQTIAADKSAVRLVVAVGASNAADALGRSRTFLVKDRQPLLLDVTDDIKAGRLGLPAVEQLQLSKLFQKVGTSTPTVATERTLLLITPQIITDEEQEEPLGGVDKP